MTEDWSYEKAKIARDERRDKREKALVAWGLFLGLIALAGIVFAIYHGSNRSSERNQEFRLECLERGGTVRYGECWGSVIVSKEEA